MTPFSRYKIRLGQTAVPIGFFSRRHFEEEHFVLVDSLPRQWGEMD